MGKKHHSTETDVMLKQCEDGSEVWRLVNRPNQIQEKGISWWLFMTIFIILFIAMLYFYQLSRTHKERENLCWRFVETGKVGRPGEVAIPSQALVHDEE